MLQGIEGREGGMEGGKGRREGGTMCLCWPREQGQDKVLKVFFPHLFFTHFLPYLQARLSSLSHYFQQSFFSFFLLFLFLLFAFSLPPS